MILSDRDIRSRLEDGSLVIDPLDDPDLQIQPASVDLRLGREFLEFRQSNIPYINPESPAQVEDYVTKTVVDETDATEQATLEATGDDTYYDDGKFILHPRDFVLGTTKERVEIPPDLIAHVEGRSSLGRLAVVVHASLPSDEEVYLWTPEGGFGFYEIGEIVEEERPAHAVSFDPRTLRVGTHRVTDYITNPTKRIYRVTLESGRQVHVTKDHNLFTLDEHGGVARIPSDEAEGALVMVPRRLPDAMGRATLDLLNLLGPEETTVYAADGVGAVDRSGVPHGSRRWYEERGSARADAEWVREVGDDVTIARDKDGTRVSRRLEVTPEFGWVLGFYIAAGCAGRNQIRVSNVEEAYLDRFAAWFDENDVNVDRDDVGRVTGVTVRSALWSKVFRELVGAGEEKIVPERAWNWPNEVLEGILDGLMDGGGCRREHRDTLFTATVTLADRVMYLATRLGLIGSMDRRGHETDVEVTDVVDEGGEWSVDIGSDAHNGGQYLPAPSDLLRRLREQAAMDFEAVAGEVGYDSRSSTTVEQTHEEGIKRSTLRRVRDAYANTAADTTRLDHLLDGDVRFERVVAVEETERIEPTYDLEVQPNGRTIENFLGGRGGVFLSNTAGLCDPGYRGQITLELSNLGTAPVALRPGMRVSQLTFTELTSASERPYGPDRGSKYQDQSGPQASRIGRDNEFEGE